MIYNNISEYLEAKNAWQQQPVSVVGGLIHLNGTSYPPAEFYAANPKPNFEPSIDQNNPDKTVIPAGVKTRRK